MLFDKNLIIIQCISCFVYKGFKKINVCNREVQRHCL